MSSVPKAVPSAVAPSAQNTVPVLTEPQLGPYKPSRGSEINPVVPRTEIDESEFSNAPRFGGTAERSGTVMANAAPTVPVNGFLFKPGPIDAHYSTWSQHDLSKPKVNNPPTRGMFTWVKDYLNHIALGTQNTDTTGFRNLGEQQRSSYMRITPPAHGAGYAPETYIPRQNPQSVRYNHDFPLTGTDRYGTGVLNSDTYGAGQTAGGIGGNRYTPQPGPPETTSTAGSISDSGMPVWG